MKCPLCKYDNIEKAKNGYYFCPACKAYIISEMEDDPDLKNYNYKMELFRCRYLEVEKAFAKAKGKFENSKFEVVAVTPNKRAMRSLLFGYEFICVKRKRKTR